MEILLTNTMEIKMQAPGLIGELDTEGDQRGGNREKRNGGKGKNGGKKMGDGNGSSIVRRDRDRRTDGKRPEAQIDLFADRAGIAWSWDSSFAMKKKDKAKVRTKAALMKSAVSFLRYAMIPPF